VVNNSLHNMQELVLAHIRRLVLLVGKDVAVTASQLAAARYVNLEKERRSAHADIR